MRITSKGQLTLPIEIREQTGLLPHTEVEFEVEGNTVLVRRKDLAPRARGQRIVEHLRGRATLSMTTDEIMALTRGED